MMKSTSEWSEIRRIRARKAESFAPNSKQESRHFIIIISITAKYIVGTIAAKINLVEESFTMKEMLVTTIAMVSQTLFRINDDMCFQPMY